eukprot:11031547-Prorocentrum_lima.AAC.1
MTVEHIVGGMEERYMRIDQKVATAILAVCERYQGKEHGVRELINRIKLQTDQAQQQRRMMGGREMLLYVVRYYSVRTECGQAYLLKDLLEIKLPKDDTGAKLEP